MTRWYDRHPYLVGACVFVLMFLAADVVIGRVRSRQRRQLEDRVAAIERTYRRKDERYHHDLVPGMNVDSARWGDLAYPVHTNSLGFKDASDRVVASSGPRPRVLFMGDSFTEGIGAPYESTFVGRLAIIAAPRGVDLLNGAVASYSPIIYWKKTVDLVQRRGVRVDEVVVFIDISDVMDESLYYLDAQGRVQNVKRTGGLLERFQAAWSDNSFVLARLLGFAMDAAAPSASATPACIAWRGYGEENCRAGWTISPAIMATYGTHGLARARVHMTMLSRFLAARGIPLTIVVYPWRSQLLWGDRQSLQRTTWRTWATAHRVAFVDLFEPSFAAADSTSVAAFVARAFIGGDEHWSATGHAFVATRFRLGYCAVVAPAGKPVTARSPLAAALCD